MRWRISLWIFMILLKCRFHSIKNKSKLVGNLFVIFLKVLPRLVSWEKDFKKVSCRLPRIKGTEPCQINLIFIPLTFLFSFNVISLFFWSMAGGSFGADYAWERLVRRPDYVTPSKRMWILIIPNFQFRAIANHALSIPWNLCNLSFSFVLFCSSLFWNLCY